MWIDIHKWAEKESHVCGSLDHLHGAVLPGFRWPVILFPGFESCLEQHSILPCVCVHLLAKLDSSTEGCGKVDTTYYGVVPLPFGPPRSLSVVRGCPWPQEWEICGLFIFYLGRTQLLSATDRILGSIHLLPQWDCQSRCPDQVPRNRYLPQSQPMQLPLPRHWLLNLWSKANKSKRKGKGESKGERGMEGGSEKGRLGEKRKPGYPALLLRKPGYPGLWPLRIFSS